MKRSYADSLVDLYKILWLLFLFGKYYKDLALVTAVIVEG